MSYAQCGKKGTCPASELSHEKRLTMWDEEARDAAAAKTPERYSAVCMAIDQALEESPEVVEHTQDDVTRLAASLIHITDGNCQFYKVIKIG
jgi:hypothetical protein